MLTGALVREAFGFCGLADSVGLALSRMVGADFSGAAFSISFFFGGDTGGSVFCFFTDSGASLAGSGAAGFALTGSGALLSELRLSFSKSIFRSRYAFCRLANSATCFLSAAAPCAESSTRSFSMAAASLFSSASDSSRSLDFDAFEERAVPVFMKIW